MYDLIMESKVDGFDQFDVECQWIFGKRYINFIKNSL